MFAVLCRRLGALAALVAAALTLFTSVAYAAPDATVTHVSFLTDQMVVAWLTTAVISFVIPAITDFVTKATAPKFVKNLVVIALSALAAAIPAVTFVHGERWTDYLFQIVIAFWTALTAHRTGYSQPIQDATAGFGIGPAAKGPVAAPFDPGRPDADVGDVGGSLPPAAPLGTPINDVTNGGTR